MKVRPGLDIQLTKIGQGGSKLLRVPYTNKMLHLEMIKFRLKENRLPSFTHQMAQEKTGYGPQGLVLPLRPSKLWAPRSDANTKKMTNSVKYTYRQK